MADGGNMDLKKLIPVICILSGVAMVVWGTLEGTYAHSWLSVFVGGALIAVLSILYKDKDKKQ